MKRKKITRNHLLTGRGVGRIIPVFILTIFYICGTGLVAPPAYAAGVPGGNITDSVVAGADVAKPAVVRIIGQASARLTVDFPNNTGGVTNVTFPQNGASYKIAYSGSGAFITSHGDILTADHVVHPDQAIQEAAAQDVADFYNKHTNQPATANDVLAGLSNGTLKSQVQYDSRALRAYLSTDFTGQSQATSLNAVPANTFADVGSNGVLQTVDFQHGDTAIVHVNMDDTPSIKVDDSTTVAPQDQLTILGFPANGDLLNANATGLAGEANPSSGFLTESLNKVYVSAVKQTSAGAPLIQVGGNVESGDSGGPALDSSGNIVGIVSFGNADGNGGETNFLQASNTGRQLSSQLNLDTQPGKFQSAWSQAFTQYSSTQAGHWHSAQLQLQQLENNYPNFHAAQPYLDYATTQASKEAAASPLSPNNLPFLIGIVLLVFVVILVLVLLLTRRKKGPQAPSYLPPYPGAILPQNGQIDPSASMARVDLKDDADLDASTTLDGQLVSSPQVPQTPKPPILQPTAQSGPIPAMPNQPPATPWPQPVGYGSAPAYGQQPYNPAQPARPAQGAAYPTYQPYPQQQPYGAYPQAAAPTWPPVSGSVPIPHPAAPYAPQNPAQQGASAQPGQQPIANRAPYGQPRPAQLEQQQNAVFPAKYAIPSDDTTMKASPPIVAGDRKNTPSSIRAVSKDPIDMATVLGEESITTQRVSDDGEEEEL